MAVENDSNLAALAEARNGAGTGFNPVFYTNSGSGVGGGLMVDGQIYHGAPPGEAEFGHLRLSPGGPIVEDRCSGWAMDRKIRERCTREPFSDLARRVGGTRGGEARHLAEALAGGDLAAREILEETAATSRLPYPMWSISFTPRSSCSGAACHCWVSLGARRWRARCPST